MARAEKSLSWQRVFRKEAEQQNMTVRQFLGHVMRGEGVGGILRRFLPGCEN